MHEPFQALIHGTTLSIPRTHIKSPSTTLSWQSVSSTIP
jgi:hypothetical protein